MVSNTFVFYVSLAILTMTLAKAEYANNHSLKRLGEQSLECVIQCQNYHISGNAWQTAEGDMGYSYVVSNIHIPSTNIH